MPIDIAGFLETVPPVYIFTTLAIVAFTFINVLAFHDCKGVEKRGLMGWLRGIWLAALFNSGLCALPWP